MSALSKIIQRFDGFDAMLVSATANIRYLSGFSSQENGVAALLLTRTERWLITDYRFVDQAQEECPTFTVVERDRAKERLGQTVARLLGACAVKTLAFEQDRIPFSLWQELDRDLSMFALVPVTRLVEQVRECKTEREIHQLRHAARIADGAWDRLLGCLAVGMTERAAAQALEIALLDLGSEGVAFPTILVSGERSCRPHGQPSDKVIENGDLVKVDFGAVVEGYRSDMTRTVVMGRADARQRAVYQTVREAQQLGIDAVRAGVPCSEPARVVADFLRASPFARWMGEGLGHAIGLELHEKPYLAENSTTILQENQVVTVEPGIYQPGWGGVRIEDDVLVAATGAERLTRSSRDLIEL